MVWKLEFIAFIVFCSVGATVFANGCIDASKPPVQRFDLNDGSSHGSFEENLTMDIPLAIPDSHIQNAEYIVMEEMRFNVTLADIHQ